MSIEESRELITCCVNNDGHIVHEPLHISCCSLNACRKCIKNLSNIEFVCKKCGKTQNKKELLDQTVNKSTEHLVRKILPQLFKAIKEKLPTKDAEILIKKLLVEKIKHIEESIDSRVKSLKIEIDKYSENYKSKLKNFNDDAVTLAYNYVFEFSFSITYLTIEGAFDMEWKPCKLMSIL